jgi:hypothetical protein
MGKKEIAMTYRTYKNPVGKVSPVVMVAGIGAVGFAIYQFWWLPKAQAAQAALAASAAQDPRQVKAAQALLQQAEELQDKNPGMSLQTAFEKIGTVGCQAVGVSYGVPPQFSSGVCALAVQLGTKIGIETTKLGYKYTKKGAKLGYKYTKKGAEFLLWTAPKFTTVKTAKVLKYAGYTAPLAVTRRTARYASKGVRKVGSTAKKIFCKGPWC